MIALLVIVSIISYSFIGGMTGYGFYATRKRRCRECQSNYCVNDHGASAGFFGAFWPLTIPMLLGALIANYFNDRESRMERKEKRLNAEHERKMTEIEAQRVATMESVKFLVENGIKADVPGLYGDAS